MNNPWLNIPASDYEGHMGLPEVGQLAFLGNVFKEALNKYDSRSLAYLGCATGNGLEYIDNKKTEQLTVIDINPEYLEILKTRYNKQIPNMEIIEADLCSYNGSGKRYSLIFAGLLFEYVSPETLLLKISNWIENKGVLVAVLQLGDRNMKKVSGTPYISLKMLEPVMNLVSEKDFRLIAQECGMSETEGKRVTLKSGKSFYIGAYQKTEYMFSTGLQA